MTFKSCKKLIYADLERLTTPNSRKGIRYLCLNASFRITFWFRVGNYLKVQKKGVFYKFLYGIVFLIHKHNQYLTGIQLSFGTQAGKGLLFAHFSCVVINGSCSIGENCTIFQGVTIGSIRGEKGGTPTIGNNVVIASGAKIIGKIKIGNNVFIAPNSVVTKDVPNNATVGGIPAKILNMNGIENCSLYR